MSQADDRLDSWKEIAAHLRRGERTVRRWEQTEGLPVYRHSHQKQSTVYAFRSELTAWLENRGNHLAKEETKPEVVEANRPGWVRMAGLAAVAMMIATIGWLYGRAFRAPQQLIVTMPLTSFSGRENYPSLSPDGKKVVFSWAREERGDYDLYILEPDSQNLRRITAGPEDDVGPVWSPDGSSIAFLRATADNGSAIFVMPAAGGPERKIAEIASPNLKGLAYGGWLAWSPDSKMLAAVERPARAGLSGLFLVALDSGEKRRLTSNGLGDFAPAFSPDGRSVAFARSRAWSCSEVFVVEIGGTPRQVTSNGGFVTSPVWRKDGKSIPFAAGETAGGRTLHEIAASSSTEHPATEMRLPVDLDEGSTFTVSFGATSDRSRVVFVVPRFDSNIWLLELAGANRTPQPARKFISSTRSDLVPQFSPDGSRIAFVSDRSGNQEIWLSNRDGSQLKQLTRFGNQPAGAPRWSPDGRWIAFDSTHGGPGINVISADGGDARRITQRGRIPSWSRDGRSIYFAGHQIMKVAAEPPFLALQNPMPVTPEGANAAFESNDGKQLFYSRNGSIWSMPVEGGRERELVTGLNSWSDFAVVDEGIFYVLRATPGGRQSIQFHKFATGTSRAIVTLERPLFVGLTASADGRSILYSQVDRDESDLMIADLPQ